MKALIWWWTQVTRVRMTIQSSLSKMMRVQSTYLHKDPLLKQAMRRKLKLRMMRRRRWSCLNPTSLMCKLKSEHLRERGQNLKHEISCSTQICITSHYDCHHTRNSDHHCHELLRAIVWKAWASSENGQCDQSQRDNVFTTHSRHLTKIFTTQATEWFQVQLTSILSPPIKLNSQYSMIQMCHEPLSTMWSRLTIVQQIQKRMSTKPTDCLASRSPTERWDDQHLACCVMTRICDLSSHIAL